MDVLKSKVVFVSLAVVMVLVLIASIIWPLTEERNKAIDDQILTDFSEISSAVTTYNSENFRIPDDLDDLDLDKDIEERAKKYDYSIDKEDFGQYELCARFKTDNRDQFEEDDEPYYGSSSSFYRARAHRAGFDCLEYEVYNYFNNNFDFDGLDSTFPQEESTEPAATSEI